MKSRVMIVVLLVLAGNLFAQKIGGLIIGDSYATDIINDRYEIASNGICGGFFIPVNIDSRINLAFRLKTCFHSVKFDEFKGGYGFGDDYSNYFNLTNELLIGYRTPVTNKITIIPQIGFGAMAEAIHRDYKYGYSNIDFFLDFSITSVYNLGSFSVGPIINFELGRKDADCLYTNKRFLFSLAIMK